MQRPKNSRLAEQIKQIKSLLVDFKKSRSKCIELAAQLRIDLNKQNFYQNTQRTTLMKCDLLDLKGLIQLKNSLVNVLGELFEKEREYAYQKQKMEAQQSLQRENRALGIESIRSSKRDNGRDNNFESMKSSRMSEMRSSRRVEVPFYKIDQEVVESVETKLDRVSKFIASLKKSIRNASENAGTKFKTKQYLLQQEPFIKAKQELEKYLMRQEELERIFGQVIKKQVQSHFEKSDTLSPDGQYYLVKVPKVKMTKQQKDQEENALKQNPAEPQEPISKKSLQTQSEQLARAEAKAEADFQDIKVELERRSQNFTQLFNQMNEVVEKGSERMSELRKKRKDAFKKDDQLWDEL